MKPLNAPAHSSGAAAASSTSALPAAGTYASSDENYTIEISAADPMSGTLTGTYKSADTPVGAYAETGLIGGFAWVFSDSQRKDGVAPFTIRFGGGQRPDSRRYAIQESWNGAYQVDGDIRASGTRAYVKSDGTVMVISLGTMLFTRR